MAAGTWGVELPDPDEVTMLRNMAGAKGIAVAWIFEYDAAEFILRPRGLCVVNVSQKIVPAQTTLSLS